MPEEIVSAAPTGEVSESQLDAEASSADTAGSDAPVTTAPAKAEPTPKAPEPAAQKPVQKEPSAFAKQREWQASMNKQQAALRKRQEEISRREKDLADKAAKLEPTPQDAEEYAKKLEDNGDFAGAEKARAYAKDLTARAEASKTQAFWAQVREQEDIIGEQDPDFADQESELGKLIKAEVAGEYGHLYRSHPMGIWAAYHKCKLQRTEQTLGVLWNAFQQLKADNEKTQQSIAPVKSTPTGDVEKSRSNLSDKEAFAALFHEAEALDRAHYR